MANENYYENLDLNYIEIAEAAEEFYTTQSSALFYIPVLMPMINPSSWTTKQYLPSNSNMLNKVRPAVSSSAYSTGAIRIPIHSERMGYWYHRNTPNLVPVGAKFLVCFVGGDINNCRILGRY